MPGIDVSARARGGRICESRHGRGLTVHGKPFNNGALVESLRYADNVILLHFSSCLMMQDGKAGELARALQEAVRFPISGYDRSVDWAASALIEFHYLDMVLGRGLLPWTPPTGCSACSVTPGTRMCLVPRILLRGSASFCRNCHAQFRVKCRWAAQIMIVKPVFVYSFDVS